ncbi:hypothetical protein AB8O55_22485 [Saccharopolyspora cebuensis]|uniref:Phosphotransferase enzyme family protein n=1 Tax=Saccharopolyspora cebuensis TaxID=418759 RepID=A0ABV4CM89_9PSEU
MTASSHPVSGDPPVFPVLEEHTRDRIHALARARWPAGEIVVGALLSSVTNFVVPVSVHDEHGMARQVAKYPILGTSLVSLTNATRGSAEQLLAAQARYTARPDAAARVEATHLDLLRHHAAQPDRAITVPEVLACDGGVLITSAAGGGSVAKALLNHDPATLESVTAAMQHAASLAADPALRDALAATAGRRSNTITATLARKFGGAYAERYLAGLGTGWSDEADRVPLVREFARVVAAVRLAAPPAAPVGHVVFGDLKPEHILIDEHTRRQVWLDPCLHLGELAEDAAKLASRLALHAGLLSRTPHPDLPRILHTVVESAVEAYPPKWRRQARARLAVWWLGDVLNVLSTALSVPPDTPVPVPALTPTAARHAPSLLAWVARMLDAVADDPAGATDTLVSTAATLMPGQRR